MNIQSIPSSVVRDFLITGLLALVAIGMSVVAGWLVLAPSSVDMMRLREDELALLQSRDVLDYTIQGENEGAAVSYTYLGEKISGTLAPDEVVGRRTESSFTRFVGYVHEGTASQEPLFTTVIYPQKTFVQRGVDWHYIEYGETTKDVFDEARRQNPIEAFFWQRVYAATFFSGAGDGTADGLKATTDSCTATSVWDATHDMSTTDVGSVSATETILRSGWSSYSDGKIGSCIIYRAFLPFDTSSIPASASISAASLTVYATSTPFYDEQDAFDYLTVVQTSQATHTTLATGDYDQCGAINSPTEGIDSGQRIDLPSISTGNTYTFTLNSTGRGWIKKNGEASSCSATAGITCLGLREGHDTADSRPDSSNATDTIAFSASEATGTSQDPYLSVSYSGQFSFWQWSDF